MPVAGNELQRFVIRNGQAVLQRLSKNDRQSNHPAEQMQSVKTRQNIEEAALERGRQVHPCVYELLPGRHLSSQKSKSEQSSDTEPPLHARNVTAADCLPG